jgi:hypothetical protein
LEVRFEDLEVVHGLFNAAARDKFNVFLSGGEVKLFVENKFTHIPTSAVPYVLAEE